MFRNGHEDAYVGLSSATPRDITRITYGGRLYNRAPQINTSISPFLESGKTWVKSYSLTSIEKPWDGHSLRTGRCHSAGTRSVLFQVLLNGSVRLRRLQSLRSAAWK